MAAKDSIYLAIKNALLKDGWVITHDPLALVVEDATVFVDLGAERVIAAERAGRKIAVEIKSFLGPSTIHDMEGALGQYMLYLTFLEIIEPDRALYLAVSQSAYESIFGRPSISLLVSRYQLAILVVDIDAEEIVTWTR